MFSGKIVKVTMGLALVVAVCLSSFSHPSLAVTSSFAYDSDNLGPADSSAYFIVGDRVAAPGPIYLVGPKGSAQPVLDPQVNEKLFDH